MLVLLLKQRFRYVCGSWDNWTSRTMLVSCYGAVDQQTLAALPIELSELPQMEPFEKVCFIPVRKEGTYQFKFVSDSAKWFCDATKPIVELSDGTRNNFVRVLFSPEVNDIVLMRPQVLTFALPFFSKCKKDLTTPEYRKRMCPVPCPWCGELLIKTHGCNRMTCPFCTMSFCNECGSFAGEQKESIYHHMKSVHHSIYERTSLVTYDMELIKERKKGKELQIAGDFNGWKLVNMNKIPKYESSILSSVGLSSETIREYVVPISGRQTEYKLCYDGKWIVDDSNHKIISKEGYTNNIIYDPDEFRKLWEPR